MFVSSKSKAKQQLLKGEVQLMFETLLRGFWKFVRCLLIIYIYIYS